MSDFKINFKKSAIKELKKLPNKEIVKLTELIGKLAFNPRPFGCKKLKAYKNLWRIRSGNYRIIYSIEDKVLIIEILKIADRKDVY